MTTFNAKRFAAYLKTLEINQHALARASKCVVQNWNPYFTGRNSYPPTDNMLDVLIKFTNEPRDLVYANAGKIPCERVKELCENVIQGYARG